MKSLQTTHHTSGYLAKESFSRNIPGLLAISWLLLVIAGVEAVVMIGVLVQRGAWVLLCEELLVVGVLSLLISFKLKALKRTTVIGSYAENRKGQWDVLLTVILFLIVHHALFNVISAYQAVIFSK